MAKDDRRISQAIRMPATDKTSRITYKTGMEDELAAVATLEQLKGWQESGAIEGNWKSAAKTKEK